MKYQVSPHKEIYAEARKMIINLEEELRKRYRDKVAVEVLTQDNKEEGISSGSRTIYSMSALTLDTNDRYLNGSAPFIIEGMKNIMTNETPPALAAQKAQEEDKYTMEMTSKGANHTNEIIATIKGLEEEKETADTRDQN